MNLSWLTGKQAHIDFRSPGVAALTKIMEEADRLGLSAKGRPGWFAKNQERVTLVALQYLFRERLPTACVRCRAVVFLADATVFQFLIDVENNRYDSLSKVGRKEMAELLEGLVNLVPHLPFDEGQRRPW